MGKKAFAGWFPDLASKNLRKSLSFIRHDQGHAPDTPVPSDPADRLDAVFDLLVFAPELGRALGIRAIIDRKHLRPYRIRPDHLGAQPLRTHLFAYYYPLFGRSCSVCHSGDTDDSSTFAHSRVCYFLEKNRPAGMLLLDPACFQELFRVS